MLPLRSVGRSNFVMVCVNKFNNVDLKATYYENCCVIYIYIYYLIYTEFAIIKQTVHNAKYVVQKKSVIHTEVRKNLFMISCICLIFGIRE